MAQRLLVHQSAPHLEQADQVQALKGHDAHHLQVGAHPKEDSKGQTSHAAAVCAQAAEDADQAPGATVAQNQHEPHVSYLPEGSTQTQRRLGIW